jgi:hypothetical protein
MLMVGKCRIPWLVEERRRVFNKRGGTIKMMSWLPMHHVFFSKGCRDCGMNRMESIPSV